jgi:hypothetical protein
MLVHAETSVTMDSGTRLRVLRRPFADLNPNALESSMKVSRSSLLAPLALVGLATAAHGGHLYAADGALSQAGNLYRVDTATGLTTTVGALVDAMGGAYAINGMAWHAASGTMFATTSGNSATLANGLVTINIATGQVTQVGLLGLTPPNFGADLDFNAGTLYGWAENSFSALMTINTATGAASIVGPNGQNINTTGSGLASNLSGTMFSTPDGSTGNLWQVNSATGQLVGPTALAGGTSGGRIGALEFLGSTLYGAELVGSGVSGITSNQLISINAVTGTITAIGQFRDASTLEFRRGIDALAVPAPGVLALFGGVGLVARRRRG